MTPGWLATALHANRFAAHLVRRVLMNVFHWPNDGAAWNGTSSPFDVDVAAVTDTASHDDDDDIFSALGRRAETQPRVPSDSTHVELPSYSVSFIDTFQRTRLITRDELAQAEAWLASLPGALFLPSALPSIWRRRSGAFLPMRPIGL